MRGEGTCRGSEPLRGEAEEGRLGQRAVCARSEGRAGPTFVTAGCQSAFQRKAGRHAKGEARPGAAAAPPAEDRGAPDAGPRGPGERWRRERRPAGSRGSGLGGHGALRELEDGQLEQDDGVTQVTCM